MAASSQFNPRMHEPGTQTVIGKPYPDNGVQQGRAVLATLARHPATAKHVAGKLARHFVADDPPPPLVAAPGEAVPRDRGQSQGAGQSAGHLTRSLGARAAEAQTPGRMDHRGFACRRCDSAARYRSRHAGAQPAGRAAVAARGAQRFCRRERDLARGLSQRLDLANQLARRIAEQADPREMFEETLGPIASAETRQAITRAESRPQALALLFMSPEFQRR